MTIERQTDRWREKRAWKWEDKKKTYNIVALASFFFLN